MNRSATAVIVVDDEPRLRTAWSNLLSKHEDFELLACLPTADELESHVPPDREVVVLMDLSMPGRDSLSAVSDLRRERELARVLIYSGYCDDETIRNAFAAGAWGFVDKLEPPLRILDLMRGIARGEPAFMLRHMQ